MEDLEMAIRQAQENVDGTPEDHTDKSFHLRDLAIEYHERHRRTGSIADLERALNLYHESLGLSLDFYLPDHAELLFTLGMAYRDRYQRTRAMVDLETAIRYSQAALDMTPLDGRPSDRARLLQSIAVTHAEQYRRTNAAADLNMFIQRSQEALDLATSDNGLGLERSGLLQNLGSGIQDRFRRTRDVADLENAIQWFQKGLDAAGHQRPAEGKLHYCLGMAYQDKWISEIGVEADLEAAFQHYQKAVDITPDGDPDQALHLYSLGQAYLTRHLRRAAIEDSKMATRLLQEALEHRSSALMDRLRPSTALLGLYARAGDWESAYDAAVTTNSLILLIAPRSLPTADKQHLLKGAGGMASDAAAIALLAGKTTYEAIRLLETGRGLILGSLNEKYTAMSDLEQQHPQLAERYINLRAELSSSTSRMQTRPDTYYRVGRDLEQTIQDIRRLPGFDQFLLPPPESELRAAAVRGPVVIINVSDYRCDALVIEKERLRVIPLPRLRSDDVRCRVLRNLVDLDLLRWLWETIAGPVLDALGYTQPLSLDDSCCWPRVWWVPTGFLTGLPIHAAGRYLHSGSDTHSVLDRVVSSYSLSISALLHSLQKRPSERTTTPGSTRKAILVGMKETPGWGDLPFASQEVRKLEESFDNNADSPVKFQVSRPRPFREEVLASLQGCEIFHFAGHGLADPLNPLKSGLLLNDELLTVNDLLEEELGRASTPFLAYLSACGTGRIANNRLADEGLHLVAAYQLAGFRHAIGTLWEAKDKSCLDVATTTYKWIQKRGMSNASVSEGLHRATRELRAQWIASNAEKGLFENPGGGQDNQGEGAERAPRDAVLCFGSARPRQRPSPLYWAPYVHFGV